MIARLVFQKQVIPGFFIFNESGTIIQITGNGRSYLHPISRTFQIFGFQILFPAME